MSYRVFATLVIVACTILPLAGCAGDGTTDVDDTPPSTNTTVE